MTEHSSTRQSVARPTVSATEWLAVLTFCLTLSIVAILWSWQHGALLSYGDAAAHLHIARRVFDCHQPRFSQLGSVWLPLPHILLIPFVQVYSWWASGLAGVVPSALAWLASCAGIYKLARYWLPPAAAAMTLCFFAVNPNLLYLQTTAMTEPLFICEIIWSTVWLVGWRRHQDESLALKANSRIDVRLLWLIAFTLVAAIYTRYDGWIMAALAWSAIAITMKPRRALASRVFLLTSALIVAAPIVWCVYNAICFGDWLYFLRGPYSAKAIELRTSIPGFPPHPGWHNPWVAFLFYVKAAEVDTVAAAFESSLIAFSLLGMTWAWITARRHAVCWAALLLLPLPFYTYSVAYGSVPIFLPMWWPFSYYNLRYGLELLPAFSLAIGFAAQFLVDSARRLAPRPSRHGFATATIVILFTLAALNAAQMLRRQPQVFVEGEKNKLAHQPYETEIPQALKALLSKNPKSVILMDSSFDPQIVALTGITFRQTINESDLQVYRDALAAPAAHASLILAFDGDDVDRAVRANPSGLVEYRSFSAPFQPTATLYVTRASDLAGVYNAAGAVIASLKEVR